MQARVLPQTAAGRPFIHSLTCAECLREPAALRVQGVTPDSPYTRDVQEFRLVSKTGRPGYKVQRQLIRENTKDPGHILAQMVKAPSDRVRQSVTQLLGLMLDSKSRNAQFFQHKSDRQRNFSE